MVLLAQSSLFSCFTAEVLGYLTPQSLVLHAMDKPSRKAVHTMANSLGLKSVSNGSGANRRPVLSKTKRTRTGGFSDRAFDVLCRKHLFWLRDAPERAQRGSLEGAQRSWPTKGKARGTQINVAYKEGEVVGAAAPEIDVKNRGRSMLEKMGWSRGSGLGAENNKGETLPISQSVKKNRAGLE